MIVTKRTLVALVAVAAVAACSDARTGPDGQEAPSFARGSAAPATVELSAMMANMNAGLERDGQPYRVGLAEYLTNDPQAMGNVVFTKVVGNKRLGHDFVPFDSRRGWSGPSGDGDDITYAIDRTGDAVPPLGGLTAAETDAAIVRSTDAWQDLTCSTLPLTRNDDFGMDIGLIAFVNGLGGSPFVFGDVQHAGWEINFVGGILGVTFTFIFIDGMGNPTDIDGNGFLDTAFREIYYDPSFPWTDDGASNVDLQTVATHEIGHGLSQAHFGTIHGTVPNGKVHFSPRAVMNALYAGPFRDLAGTDRAGHCGNWANWPNG